LRGSDLRCPRQAHQLLKVKGMQKDEEKRLKSLVILVSSSRWAACGGVVVCSLMATVFLVLSSINHKFNVLVPKFTRYLRKVVCFHTSINTLDRFNCSPRMFCLFSKRFEVVPLGKLVGLPKDAEAWQEVLDEAMLS